MLTIIALTLLAQSQPAVRRSTPASDDPGMVVRQVGTVTTTCTNCSSGAIPDGGNIGYMRMPDGGPLEVTVTSGGGGSGGAVTQGAGQDGGAWVTTAAVRQSPGNSSTTLLGIGGTFTGTWEDVSDFGFVTVTSSADTNGSVIYDWSTDGVTASKSDSAYVPAGAGYANTVPVKSRYFRLRYTNGNPGQTTFTLATMYRQVGGTSTVPLGDTVAIGAPATVGRSVLMGTTNNLTYNNAIVTSSGALSVDGYTGTFPATQSGTWNMTATQGPGRDGGPWEVYSVNAGGSAWVPDGGFIGTVAQEFGGGSYLPVPLAPAGASVIVSGNGTSSANITDLRFVDGDPVAMGTGAGTPGTQRVALDSDSSVRQGTNTADGGVVWAAGLPSVEKTCTLANLGDTCVVAIDGHGGIGFQWTGGGTLDGEVTLEYTLNGTDWVAFNYLYSTNTGNRSNNPQPVSSVPRMAALTGGMSQVRLRVSLYNAGSSNVTMRATAASLKVDRFAGENNSSVSQGVQIGAANESLTGMNLLKSTSDGRLLVTTDSDGGIAITQSPAHAFSGWVPDPSSSYSVDPTQAPAYDPSGALYTRGQVTTDEGMFSEGFPGAALATALTGTMTFTNGGTSVAGAGTAFLTEVTTNQYIKASAHGETAWARVSKLISDTQLELEAGYGGATVTSTGDVSNWKTQTPAGASMSVSGSVVTLTNSTTNGDVLALYRGADYSTLNMTVRAAISARYADQPISFALVDALEPSTQQEAEFRFSGTTNTQVECVTAFDSGGSNVTTVTIPGGGTTATQHTYEISQGQDRVTFIIDGILVATHQYEIPDAYRTMTFGIFMENTAPLGASASVDVSWVHVGSVNRFDANVVNPVAARLQAQVQGAQREGDAISVNPIIIGGTDGAVARTMKVTSAGSVLVTGDKTNNLAASDNTNIGTLPAVATTSAPTYVDGRTVALSTDTSGSLRTSASQSGAWNVTLLAGTNYFGKTRLTDGTLDLSLLNSAPGSDTGQIAVPVRIISSLAGGAGGTSSSYGSAFPASGTAAGFSDGTNMRPAHVFDADTGAGSEYLLGSLLRVSASGGSVEAAAGAGVTTSSTLRVVLPTDQTSIPVTQSGAWSASLNAGTNYVGKTRLTDGTLDVSLLNSAPGSDTGQVSVPVRIISSLAGGAGGTSSSFGSAFPASGTAAGFSDGTNMASARVFDADTGGGTQNVLGVNLRVGASGGSTEAAAGAGTTSASTLRVVLPTDQTAVPVTDNGGSLTVDGTVGVSGNVTVVQPTGTNLHVVVDTAPTTTVTGTVAATQSGTWSVRTQDGAGNALASSTSAPAGTEQALIVRNIPSGTQTVSGTVTANAGTGPWPVTDNGGSLTVDGTVAVSSVGGTVTVSGTVDTELPAAAALGDAVANPTTTTVGTALLGFNGTTWDRLRSTIAGGLLVDISDATLAVTQSGTWNLTNISGTISLPTGAATETTLGTRLAESTFTGRFAAGALLADNFANPTTTGVGAFGMLWNGATWDRAPGTSVDGMLVNLGLNNDVTVTSGTVTANAGTGTFTVGQATAANLRAQTSAESATAAAVPANAMAVGYKDTSGNLQHPVAVDGDTGAGTQWFGGSILMTSNSGGAAQVTGRGTADGYNGISVHMLYKATSTITNTAVSCSGTATAMPASVQSNRSTITVYNNGSQTVYVGSATVTTATGIPIPPGGYWVDDVRVAAYYCIVTSGSAEVRVMEQ